jgi:hypothetical protein
MSITSNDIVLYSSQNMPVNDTDSGGSINSGIRLVFEDIVATDVIEASGGASDSGTLTVTGRNAAGSIVSDVFALSGITIVSGDQLFERILVTSYDTLATGTITLRDASTDATLGTIYPTESGFRRPFYDATAEAAGGSDKDLYEKMFVKNNNTVNALLGATVTEVVSGVYALIEFALDDAHQYDEETVANRLAAPTGTGPFGSGISGVPSTDLAPLDYLGIWLHLDLTAGTAAQNSFYQINIDGRTT